MEEETIAERKERISSMTYTELVVRKDYLISQLPADNRNPADTSTTKSSAVLPTLVIPKLRMIRGPQQQQQQVEGSDDVHWDYVLKELMWLSADFASERKRQISQAKRLSSAVMSYHNTKQFRLQKELAELELRKRKIASKISKIVMKQFWVKVERLITYKQHLIMENERQQRMDQHLRSLVQRTELYSQSLQQQRQFDTNIKKKQSIHAFTTTANSVEGVLQEHFFQQKHSNTTSKAEGLSKHSSRNQKKLKIDYNQLLLASQKASGDEQQHEDIFFYGQPVGEEDSSFCPSSNNSNSEINGSGNIDDSFQQALLELHPSQLAEEIVALQQESKLDLQEILTTSYNNYSYRLEDDDDNSSNASSYSKSQSSSSTQIQRNVGRTNTIKNTNKTKTEREHEANTAALLMAPPSDKNQQPQTTLYSSGSEDYTINSEEEPDDETTFIEEERLGREMSAEEEIALLQQENEIPVEQLLSSYFSKPQYNNGQQHQEVEDTEQAISSSSSSGSDDFVMEEEVDDETTLIEEERLGREMTVEEEIALLQQENEIPVEDLLSSYFSTTQQHQEEEMNEIASTSSSSSGSEEYVMDTEEVDDETTLIEEEHLGREMSAEEEIALLQQENELPIEQLLSSYVSKGEIEEPSDGTPYISGKDSTEENDAEYTPISVLGEKGKERESTGDKHENLSIIEALQSSETRARELNVTRPFLLSSWVKLRPYQQIGLNWLVSLHSRRLNGILADEMGLGKTLQTISMLAYLAAYKGIWGPHLIIVPTSVILNWETEFKRFCPAFKVLCYYGSAKRRKELRKGWSRTNWHHIIVTSYQLAVQDSFAFKRKRWYYLILDEAHNIKNFQSQRWQTLINFNTQRRLLLTGTPLQNNLMELWSLLHFLMPHIFHDRKEFSYWFSNPMNQMVEGNATRNDELISRLHGIIRPFVLRRLKVDVETQMPGKHEHIVKCQLSRRQMFLYEEFMGRSSTRMAVKKRGNFLGMMNVLMQLRKVCNHPDLFDPRSILTPLFTDSIQLRVPGLSVNAFETSPYKRVSASMIHSLWSKSSGIPFFNLSLDYDNIVAAQVQSLQGPQVEVNETVFTEKNHFQKPERYSPGLLSLLTSIWACENSEAQSIAKNVATVSSKRCRSDAFPYSNRTRQIVSVQNIFTEIAENGKFDLSATSIAQTPTQLLEMMRTYQERSNELDSLIERFVFCVPKAGARHPECISTSLFKSEGLYLPELDETFQRYFSLFKKASSRLTSFFPEHKLVQFDAGKLVVLADLLKDLRKGGHRVLIFTQMTKMLDILEAFVNLHGLSYLRLDGSVGVDERQRLMDRFNNDQKIFCFILSTRSGGLGINLTGADTVVFYDSDWCPSIDAQAQDRAHRIGQTREVHIYRLITEHTIEENILLRARQKRQLDYLVMDKGKFHALSSDQGKESGAIIGGSDEAQELFTKRGLRDILGVTDEDSVDDNFMDDTESSQQEVSMDQVEKTMAALEDEDDARAKIGAEKEAACELQEFDESIQFSKDAEDDGGFDSHGEDASRVDDTGAAHTNESHGSKRLLKRKAVQGEEESQADGSVTDSSASEEGEKGFEEWQNKVGINLSTISESLSSVERYALKIKEFIDPFYSARYLEGIRKLEEQESSKPEWDADEIEEAKAAEERRAVEEGDLLVTKPNPKDLIRQRFLYLKEKSRRRSAKKGRILTGENWCVRADAFTNNPFWYNIDTGEAIWEKPLVLIQLEAEENARKNRWGALPMKSLVHVMSYLTPYPDRMRCALVCRQFRLASTDISFVRHVWPVECGALTMEKSKLDQNHYVSIEDAVSSAQPGDTIELGDGHYWVKDLTINFPLRFVGDENDPSHVAIELSGSICWTGSGGWMEGVTIRRPRLSNDLNRQKGLIFVGERGWLDINHCVFHGAGSASDVVTLSGKGNKGRWNDVVIKGAAGEYSGLVLQNGASVNLSNGTLEDNDGCGLTLKENSSIQLTECRLVRNGRRPICFLGADNFISDRSKNNVCDVASQLLHPSFRFDDTTETMS